MANYYGAIRSNYFHVNNVNQLKKLCNKIGATITERKDLNGGVMYTMYSENGFSYDCDDLDLPAEIAKLLTGDDVAVFIEVGREKMRYLVGYAWCVNAKGETETVDLDEIYEYAGGLGNNVTMATY